MNKGLPLLTAAPALLCLPMGTGLPPIIPVRWHGNPNARISQGKTKPVKIRVKKQAPEPEFVLLPRMEFKEKVVTGAVTKCSACGDRLQCKLDKGFLDLCTTPKPVPKGTVVLNGHAIVFFKKPTDEMPDPNRKPVFREAADIDEIGQKVSLKVKVLRLWDSKSDKVAQLGLVGDMSGNVRVTIWKEAYQPMLKLGASYHIKNATTDYFRGGYQVQITERTLIQKMEFEVKAKNVYINSPVLSMFREDSVLPEEALRVPGIDEPKPRFEDYSATPFLSLEDNYGAGEEFQEEQLPDDMPEIDSMDSSYKLKKKLTTLYAMNPAKAKEVAAKLTPNQLKSIDKVGGLNKELAFGICKTWEEPERESNLKATPEGWEIVTKSQKAERLGKAIEKKQDKFMINHGFRLKDKLEDLMLRDPVKAKAFAAKLTFDDWKALSDIGGLNTSKPAEMVIAR
ncbi:MAG: hypothetical protein WA130_04025 [Candidatus Methanoperedens sp.]